MIFYNTLISILLFTVTVFASNKMTYYGCPDECETQEDPSCGKEITTDYFAALSTKIGNYCDNYVVVMETKANANKLVRAKVVDSCSSCPTYHVDLSKKAFTTLTKASVGKSEIIWSIHDRSGKLIKGPYFNSVSKVASSYGLSDSSFISAFKIAAGKIASNGSSSGTFSISHDSGSSGSSEDKQTTTKKTTTRKITSVSTKITTTTSQKKVITTIVYKKPSPSPSNESTPSNDNREVPANNDNSSNNNNSSSNTSYDGENKDTITYDNTAGNNIPTPSENTASRKSPIVINPSDVSSGPVDGSNGTGGVGGTDDNDGTAEVEIINEEEGGNTGATVGVITAITCLGAGGAGLMFMKKKNPNKYEELKKSFPDAFTHVKSGISRSATSVKNGLKRSVTKMRGRQGNVTLPSHNTYMPADTIGDDGLPRISLYDNPPSHPMQQVN